MPRQDRQGPTRGNEESRGGKIKPVWPVNRRFPITSGFGARSSPGGIGSTNHDGIDIGCPTGTQVVSVLDGRVTVAGDNGGYGIYVEIDHGGGHVTFYGHLKNTKVNVGDKVNRGQVIGISNNTGSSTGDHLHFGYHLNGQATDPMRLLSGAIDPSDIPPGAGSGDSAGPGTFDEADLFAVSRAAAISTWLQLPGLMNLKESILLTGAKSIYNDEPLMPFVEQLCKASLRQFQSLPNGAFFAFFPDQFGMYGHRKPYWNIDNIEIIDGGIDLTDESLATHVFVVGDTDGDVGTINLNEKTASKGVITIYDAFMSDRMIAGRDRDKDQGRAKGKQKDKMQDKLEADNFLRKYGIRPHYEEATFIRNSFFEIFYAFTQFQILWANQFRTTFQFTFMPELYPGGIVAFEDHGIQCYIDSVTHSFDYEGGFTTSANLSAPSALGGKASPISQGMIRPFNTSRRANTDPDGHRE